MSSVVMTVAWAVATIGLGVASAVLERSSHIRLRHWAEEASERLRRLHDSPSEFEAFRWILAVLARVAPLGLLVSTSGLLLRVGAAEPVWIAVGVVTVLLITIEWLNRLLVQLRAEAALRALTLPLRLATLLLWPAVWVAARLVRFGQIEAEEDEEEATDGEIDAFIDVGRREGILEPEEELLVRSVVDFGDTQAREVMTPRVDVFAAAVDAEPEAVAQVFLDSKNTRLPIYKGSIDHTVGVLHIRDFFAAQHSNETFDLESIAKRPHFVPDDKPLPELLTEMQARHLQMAIVVDAFGGVAGLVTVEDLVEEIVGDIRDEHEEAEEPTPIEGGGYEISGQSRLEDVEDLFAIDLQLDTVPYGTLSGLVCGTIGQVPASGREVDLPSLRVRVEEADDRRILRAAVWPIESVEKFADRATA
ncbi:MAG: hemolysin family protein [Acidobacteriota bacterium]